MISYIPTTNIATMTDQEWGRLYRFGGSGDAGLIMPPRSYYFRKFNAGNWFDLSMGMIYGGTIANAENGAMVSEGLNSNSIGNLFHFGLSNPSNTGIIDVSDNRNFLGMRALRNSQTQILAANDNDLPGELSEITQVALTLVNNGIVTERSPSFSVYLDRHASNPVFSMIGMRFIRNLANVTIRLKTVESVTLSSPGADQTTLEAFLRNITSSEPIQATIPLLDVTNLTAFYLFWPYVANRLKLHAVGAIKFS